MLSTHLAHAGAPSFLTGVKPLLGEAEQSRALVRVRLRQKCGHVQCQPLSQDTHCPERPGYFSRQDAQAVGTSESLLPVSTMLAPRIPGSTTQACWLSPQGAWGGFWQHPSPGTQACTG